MPFTFAQNTSTYMNYAFFRTAVVLFIWIAAFVPNLVAQKTPKDQVNIPELQGAVVVMQTRESPNVTFLGQSELVISDGNGKTHRISLHVSRDSDRNLSKISQAIDHILNQGYVLHSVIPVMSAAEGNMWIQRYFFVKKAQE